MAALTRDIFGEKAQNLWGRCPRLGERLSHGHHFKLPHLGPYKVVCEKKGISLLGLRTTLLQDLAGWRLAQFQIPHLTMYSILARDTVVDGSV